MSNVLVTGVNGQLGSEIKALSGCYAYHFYFTDQDELDITDTKAIQAFAESNAIDIIINCAAYTAVDKAEEEREAANAINHLAIKNLAFISKEKNIKLIHISTDYVFDGTNSIPYQEDDSVNPPSVYGQSKLDGENALQQINPKESIIIRTSWLYSSCGNNFLKTMLCLGKEKDSLGVIFDQVGTPTYAKDLAKMILDILPNIHSENVEIYHYSNEGVCSWYDFAQSIMQLSSINCQINPIETKEYPTPAKRPHFSVLNKSKIKQEFNLTIPYWRESVKECLAILGENIS